MPSVTPRTDKRKSNEEPFDRMLRRWKKSCERAGIVQEVRDRQHFEKPSSIKNEQKQAIKRRKKINAKRAAQKGFRLGR